MRRRRTFLGTFALALSLARPAAAGALLVAQLAGDPAAIAPDAAGMRAAYADAAAIAHASPQLAVLGCSVRRALLDALPPPRRAVRAAVVPGIAFERVVLLEAAGSGSAALTCRALVDAGLVDWAEPLRMRWPADAPFVAARPAREAPSTCARLDTLPNDPLLRDTNQWGLLNAGASGGAVYGGVARADVHAVEAWRASVGADDLRLAIADTGIDPAQPELGGAMRDGSPRIIDALDVTGEVVPAVTDSFGHGTLVAGVMAARTNDGPHFSGRGVAGVCGGDGVTTTGCRIVPIRIAAGHSGSSSSFDIANAILYAADEGARAVNLSFAGTTPSRLERQALQYAIARGCVCVAAAGNNGMGANPRQPIYPAAYAADGLCIQVGASNWNDARAPWSSYGPGVDLVAPGMSVWTTFMTYPSYYGAFYDGYAAADGTSYAAPFVTGAVGLLAAARPELVDDDFQHVLRESADDVGAPGVDEQTGWGRLDIGRALDAVRPEVGIWHDEADAQSVRPDTTSALLNIGECGTGTLDRYSGQVPATRHVALATIAVPDSFVDSVRVWVRVGGTTTARGDYQLPYYTPVAQVIANTGRTFTLRGWLYRADNDDDGPTSNDPWIPLPPEYMRFAFTVMGRVRHAAAAVTAPAPHARLALLAGPNPFRVSLQLTAPGPGRITVLDAGGRVVRSLTVPGGPARWEGCDDAGTPAPPGLYFIRWRDALEACTVRAVKLNP